MSEWASEAGHLHVGGGLATAPLTLMSRSEIMVRGSMGITADKTVTYVLKSKRMRYSLRSVLPTAFEVSPADVAFETRTTKSEYLLR